MRKIRSRKKTPSSCRGIATVEFAVCVPVLVLIVFSGIEVNHMISLRNMASQVSYFAARDTLLTSMTQNEITQRYTTLAESSGLNNIEIDFIQSRNDITTVEVSIPLDGNGTATNFLSITTRAISARSHVYQKDN